MKKKVVLIFGLVLVGLFSLGTSIAWGEVSSLPRVTTVCESKAGLLMTVDDDFSILKKCPKNFRKVVLGEETMADESENMSKGSLFVYKDGGLLSVLLTDGSVVETEVVPPVWTENAAKHIPSTINVSEIIFWNKSTFLTKENHLWIYQKDFDAEGGWIDVGIPNNN